MTDAPLFTPEDVARLQRSARYLRHPDAGTIANAEAGGFEDIAERIQQWLDQQPKDPMAHLETMAVHGTSL